MIGDRKIQNQNADGKQQMISIVGTSSSTSLIIIIHRKPERHTNKCISLNVVIDKYLEKRLEDIGWIVDHQCLNSVFRTFDTPTVMKAGGLALWNLIQPTISLEMAVPSQDHYGFHSFPVVDWFCLFIYLWVLTFSL